MEEEKAIVDSKKLSLTEIMFEFVRSAVLEREPLIPSNEKIDWDRLMDISTKQGLIAWVWDGICRLPQEQQPPRQQRINWGLSAQEIWERYAHQKEVLTEIVEICKQNGIRLLLLKGLGLSELYPKPQSRPSGDIDIYLFGDFEKGNLLFSENRCPETELHTSFNYKGIEIENHKIFVYNNSKVKGLVGEYVMSHVQDALLGADGYYTLPPMANLAYLLMHALNHVDYSSEETIFSIKHVLDLGMFILNNKAGLPSEEVYQTLKRLRLDKSFELVVYLSEWLLGISLKEYHAGLIKQKDIGAIKSLFVKQGLSVPIVEGLPFLKHTYAWWKRYFVLKPIARYIPKKPKCSLLRVTFYQQIRHFFNIPDGCSVKEGLKMKFNKIK